MRPKEGLKKKKVEKADKMREFEIVYSLNREMRDRKRLIQNGERRERKGLRSEKEPEKIRKKEKK